MEENLQKKCKHCGKMFTPTSTRPDLVLYCSAHCKYAEDAAQARYTYTCTHCGAVIYRNRKLQSAQPFCGQACLSAYQHAQAFENRSCEQCGVIFECSKKSKQRFCSASCQQEWQRCNPRCGMEHPSYRKDIPLTERTLICEWCGKEYVVDKPYKIKNSRFCSGHCRHSAMIEAARTEKTWEERVDTAPQRAVNEILTALGINYINEYRCGWFSLDNYCIDAELPIEVMGTYWHADPRKYDKISALQKRDIIEDKRKQTFIRSHLHAEILYIWEDDLRINPALCQALIRAFIERQGVLEDYHSYNYHLVDGQLCLNSNLIVGYIEATNDYHSLVVDEKTLND